MPGPVIQDGTFGNSSTYSHASRKRYSGDSGGSYRDENNLGNFVVPSSRKTYGPFQGGYLVGADTTNLLRVAICLTIPFCSFNVVKLRVVYKIIFRVSYLNTPISDRIVRNYSGVFFQDCS